MAGGQVERWPVERLVPYARNARTHSDAQIAQLAGSIREWGWTVPVLVDESGMLIAGHGRVLAARQLGLADIPVMIARGWSEAQKRAYVIADNKLAMNAGWDVELLKVELNDLKALGTDLGLVGFEDGELAELFADRSAGLTDPDDIPDVLPEPVSVLGDMWMLGEHRLVCGDSTDEPTVARALSGTVPLLMVTDPPYGVRYDPKWRARAGVNKNRLKLGAVSNDDRADWHAAWAHFPGSVAYVWCASTHNDAVIASLESCGFERRSQIIWCKDRFALGRGHYHWQHEPCWYAVRGDAHWRGDRSQSTVWHIKAREDQGSGHGTQKPVECMRRPIENNSSPGQPVYEPFCGSGTTIIAAEITGRACHAIELNPVYVDVAIRRWQAFTGKAAIQEANGCSFAEIAAQRGIACEMDSDGATRQEA